MLWTACVSFVVSAAILAANRDLFPFFRRLLKAGYQLVVWRLLPAGDVVPEGGRKIPFALIIAIGSGLALLAEWRGWMLI